MLETLLFYLEYPFVRYALVVGTLIALCSSLLGVNLVMKRLSFIGDGLSHVAFGAMAIATVLELHNDMIFVMPVTVVIAMLLFGAGKKIKIKGDALIAMFSTGALAIGYLVLNVFSVSANISGDVCTTLFGSTSILTLSKQEVVLCIVISCLVVVMYGVFYNRIFAVTFDEDFTKAIGMKSEWYNGLLAVITAVIIVLAMNLVGSLLISALIIFPVLSAMRVVNSYKAVVIYATILSMLTAVIGIVVSILCSTPVGSTIVAMHIFVFVLNSLIGKVMRR